MATRFAHRYTQQRLEQLPLLLLLLAAPGCGGEDLGCGGPFCITPPDQREPVTMKAGAGNGQRAGPGRRLVQPLEVIVTDEDERPAADVEVRFDVAQGNGSLSDLRVLSDNQGRARVQWTLGPDPGPNGVQAAATNSSGQPLAGSPLTFSALAIKPPPARLILRVAPPDAAQNDVPFVRQPVIEVLDADLLPVPEVEVLASMTSGGGTLEGTTTVSTDASGHATYTDLAVVGIAGPRTLRFSVADPLLEVSSGSIQIGAGAASQVSASSPVTYEGIVSSPVAPAPSVSVKDQAGNPVPGVEVVFAPDRDASVSPGTATTDGEGIARVTSWTLGTATTGQYTLRAQVPASSIDPVVFTAKAKAGAAGGLTIALQPSSPAESGTPLAQQPVIQMVDRLGNPASQADVLITATVASGPSGSLAGATAVTDGSGLATFSRLSLSGLVGDYALSFSAPDLAGVTSSSISLRAGPPARLALVVSPPPTARSRAPLAQQPSIQLQDASGNPVAQPGVQLLASVASGGATLAGQAAVSTGADGSATFSDLSIVGPPGPYTLRFATTNPDFEIISGPITLPAVADVVVLTRPQGSAVVGTRLASPAAWQFTDASNQPVADVPVELSISPGGSVEPAAPASDASGILQLESWTLGTLAGEQFVDFPLPGGIGTPAVFVIAAPDVQTRLRLVSGDGQSAPVNTTLPALMLVQVVDRYDNGVGGISVVWRTCDGRGQLEQATDDHGLSSAAQSTGSVPGTFCVRASSSGLQGSPVEFHFTVTSATGSVQTLPTGKLERAPPPEQPRGPPR